MTNEENTGTLTWLKGNYEDRCQPRTSDANTRNTNTVENKYAKNHVFFSTWCSKNEYICETKDNRWIL